MIKNNIFALILHLLIGFLIALFYQSVENFNSLGIYLDIMFSIVVLGLYFLTGYFLGGKLISLQKKSIMNLMSVSSISFISIGLWIYCSLNENGVILAKAIWLYYFNYNFFIIPLAAIMKKWANFYAYLWNFKIIISFIPVLLIWLGMEVKRFCRLQCAANQDRGI
jgi:hypothetical protein